MSKWILIAILFGCVACDRGDDFCERYVAAQATAIEALGECRTGGGQAMTVEQCNASDVVPAACNNPGDKEVLVAWRYCYSKYGKCTIETKDAYYDSVNACHHEPENAPSQECLMALAE